MIPMDKSNHDLPKRKTSARLGPFLLLKTLGVGEFGKVKMGKHVETDQKVAVKLVKKEDIDSLTQLDKIRMEIEILKTLNHPYIVKLLTVNETESCIGIVLEYAEGGELFEYIYKQKFLQEDEARRLFSQLISNCHGNLIVTDFGFANQFSPATGDSMSTSCGSPCYAAPELVMTGNSYSGKATDIWSSGVILYAMLCGYLPFDDDTKNPNDNIGRLYRYIMVNKPKYPSRISFEAQDIIGKMLVPDPSNRCTIETVMAHPWLHEYANLFKKTVSELEMEAERMKEILLKGTSPDLIKNDYCSSYYSSHHHSSSESSSPSSLSYSYTCFNHTKDQFSQESVAVVVEKPEREERAENEPEVGHSTPQPPSDPVTKPKESQADTIPIAPVQATEETKEKVVRPSKRSEPKLSQSISSSLRAKLFHRKSKKEEGQGERGPARPQVLPKRTKSTNLLSWIKHKTHKDKTSPDRPTDLESQAPDALATQLRTHTGDLNRSALTSKAPSEVLQEITKILRVLGIDVDPPSGARLVCTRQSTEAIYGHPDLDSGEPIQFTIEICRFENLSGLFCVDMQPLAENDQAYRWIGQKILNLLHLKNVIRTTDFQAVLSTHEEE
ncbi:hypothetical protein G6F52_004828 [Rhizopus delemar]|uniref:non-specific serine/threonine protein kinase n=2 Tax=Rhizopus TaxID=4842 RepID=A0A9P6Z3C5_9FUNG|nr:hypothetical protein G6F52_004828 [Rhizopus delemar]KAG1569915.1 hypothetical protein G6F50_005950 [Rhizopus delemar]